MSKQVQQTIATGAAVKIDNGFGRFSYGIVRGFDGSKKNAMGWVGNYTIELTGGLTVMGRPVAVGAFRVVLHTHVSVA